MLERIEVQEGNDDDQEWSIVVDERYEEGAQKLINYSGNLLEAASLRHVDLLTVSLDDGLLANLGHDSNTSLASNTHSNCECSVVHACHFKHNDERDEMNNAAFDFAMAQKHTQVDRLSKDGSEDLHETSNNRDTIIRE